MYQSMYNQYLDSEVLTADPIKLIQLLYRGALDAVRSARTALAARDIPTRCRLASKAMAILNELAVSLDHSVAPDFSHNMVELYDYMLRRLIEGNTQQTDGPLAEVEHLLADLLSAWQQAGDQQQTPAEAVPQTAYTSDSNSEYQLISVAY